MSQLSRNNQQSIQFSPTTHTPLNPEILCEWKIISEIKILTIFHLDIPKAILWARIQFQFSDKATIKVDFTVRFWCFPLPTAVVSSGQAVWIISINQLVIYCNNVSVFRPMRQAYFYRNILLDEASNKTDGGKTYHMQTDSLSHFFVHERRLCYSGWLLPSTHCCSSPWLSASGIKQPTLTPVQQLDPWGTLLASTPTHSTPWCQNTEHSGIAQTAQSRANRQKLSKITQLCRQIFTRLLANRHVESIRSTWGTKCCICLWMSGSLVLTSDNNIQSLSKVNLKRCLQRGR